MSPFSSFSSWFMWNCIGFLGKSGGCSVSSPLLIELTLYLVSRSCAILSICSFALLEVLAGERAVVCVTSSSNGLLMKRAFGDFAEFLFQFKIFSFIPDETLESESLEFVELTEFRRTLFMCAGLSFTSFCIWGGESTELIGIDCESVINWGWTVGDSKLWLGFSSGTLNFISSQFVP